MIEQGLYFATWAFFVAFFAMLIYPLVWRRALRVSYARLECALPSSLEDIIADQDRIRAKYAVDLAKAEQMNDQFIKTITDTKIKNSVLREEIAKKEEERLLAIEKMNSQEEEYRRVFDFVDAQSAVITTLLTLLLFVPFDKLAQSHKPNLIGVRAFIYYCLSKLMEYMLRNQPNNFVLLLSTLVLKKGYSLRSAQVEQAESKERVD